MKGFGAGTTLGVGAQGHHPSGDSTTEGLGTGGQGKFSHDRGWGWERQQEESCAGRAARSWESLSG